MTDDEVLRVHEVAQDKELIVVDEIHKYWRAAQRRMADDITDFISEHRHRGIDIIGMGQNLNDLHSIWRFRCNRKLTFMKLDAIGQENRYSWTSYNGSLISKRQSAPRWSSPRCNLVSDHTKPSISALRLDHRRRQQHGDVFR
jgi:zona occludens toxin